MRLKNTVGAVLAAGAMLLGAGQANAIVGGEHPAEAPSWMGSLQVYNAKTGQHQHGCGASLIAPEWAVTARHCIIKGANTPEIITDTPVDPKLLQVRFGSVDNTSGGTVAQVAEIKKPPGNPISTVGTDIALLRLAEPVPGEPIKIADNGALAGPTRLLGWGMECAGQRCAMPKMLNQLDTQTIADVDCIGLAIHFTVENCIGEWNTGKGAHFGDSGGPAVRMIDRQWQLTGATSRVMNAGNAPTIYVDVPAWRQWLRETTGINTL